MSTNVKKITKKSYLNTLTDLVEYAESNGVTLEGEMTFDGIKEFINHEVELLDNKAAAAAKRAAEKRVEGDALREKILDVLTSEFQSISDIVAALGDSNITPQMITPRLTQLVNLEQAEKDQITVAGVDGGKSRKVSAYRIKE